MDYPATVFLTCLTVAAGAESKRITHGQSFAGEPIVAAFVLGIFLYVFGFINEQLASMICALVIVGALIVNGQSIITALSPKHGK